MQAPQQILMLYEFDLYKVKKITPVISRDERTLVLIKVSGPHFLCTPLNEEKTHMGVSINHLVRLQQDETGTKQG